MTLLVISPDYASHLLPLATIATGWSRAGDRVVVATGPANDALVGEFGFERVDLRLGRGSNPGIIEVADQPRGEDDNLRAFFAATRRGMIETLRYQAEARRSDLLWEPVASARRVIELVEQVRPDQILVDHLAFGATLGLQAAGIAYTDVVLGHPTALPVGNEVYGSVATWPTCFDPDPAELAGLDRLCRSVRDQFTEDWNAATAQIAPSAAAVDDAFAVHGDRVLFNYPGELHEPERELLVSEQVGPHTFLGASVRTDDADAEIATWFDGLGDRPVVYVSFGSFLSARADVLAEVAAALRMHGRRRDAGHRLRLRCRSWARCPPVAGAALPPSGRLPRPRRRRRHPRRQQQRHRVPPPRCPDGGASLLDRPVRRRRRPRTPRLGHRPGSQHLHR